MTEIIKEKVPRYRERGYVKSFWVNRSDLEFFMALERYLKLKELSLSDFIMRACKYVILQDGSTHHTQFLEVYKEVVFERVSKTKVKYKGKVVSFEKILNDIINNPDSFVKF